MPLKRDQVERALRSKLMMRLDEGRDHRYYELYVDDQFVLQTKISTGTGYRNLGTPLVSKIAKQLKVSNTQFQDLVTCASSTA